jgi:hypothetical protein
MLTIMDVSKERFMLPHCVSEVAAGVDAIRTALTGWYQLRGDEGPFARTLNWRE